MNGVSKASQREYTHQKGVAEYKSLWKICAFLWLESFGQEMMKLQISEKGVCVGVTEVQVSQHDIRARPASNSSEE